MQIVVGTATRIGSAFVDLAPSGQPGSEQDALCLVPWMPTFVNGGHECVIAVSHNFAEAAPLPDPLPNGFDFQPPAHDEIAQRNLSVIADSLPRVLTITAPARSDKLVLVTAEIGGELNPALLAQLGLKGLKPATKEVVQVNLSREAICEGNEKPSDKRGLEVKVPRGTATGVYVSIRTKGLGPNEYQLVHIIERSEDRILGGISYAATHSYERTRS
jgi:hypothetical protein